MMNAIQILHRTSGTSLDSPLKSLPLAFAVLVSRGKSGNGAGF
jgi:hypothetical protein